MKMLWYTIRSVPNPGTLFPTTSHPLIRILTRETLFLLLVLLLVLKTHPKMVLHLRQLSLTFLALRLLCLIYSEEFTNPEVPIIESMARIDLAEGLANLSLTENCANCLSGSSSYV